MPQASSRSESTYYEFNLLPGRFNRPVVAREAVSNASAIEFYIRPEVSGRFAGYPVYDGADLVITRPGWEPWAAATYGRVLKAVAAEYEKDRVAAEGRLAALKKTNEETQSPAYEQKMREHLEKYSGQLRSANPRELAARKADPQRDKDGSWYWNPIDAHVEAQKKLAAMTPVDAARPACYLETADKNGRYAIQGAILPAGSAPECKDLVRDNYDYFDPRLPRSAAQLLVVRSIGRCATIANGKLAVRGKPRTDFPPQGCFKHVPMWEEMDWSKVAALLAP